MVAVICGHLVASGVAFSTNLAHPALPPGPARPSFRAARRARDRQPDGPGSIAASYARYSSDQQDASSIDQQQRKCRDAARANGHDLRPEFEFADHAVSGSRPDRHGLQDMLAAGREGKFRVLYFESLSRLAREFVISAPMLKELVYVHHVRVVSTSEGIDSDRAGWELMATFRSWMHTEFLKQLRAAVLRGQEEAVLSDYSAGDWGFGYGSEPVPESESARRGRNAKPRMKVVVDAGQAEWVRRVFAWFVTERRSLAWIARQMTRLGCPKDRRSTTPDWRPSYVRRLLRNQKYVGIWTWGKKTNVLNPITGKVRQEECSPEDFLQFTRERPELRLVDDDLFFKAQGLLDHNEAELRDCRKDDGRVWGSTRDPGRPCHLLQGLIACAACGSTFTVGGANGKYLRCDKYGAGACAVKTMLPRERAERILLRRVGEIMLANTTWREAVHAAAVAAWASKQSTGPGERGELEKRLAAVEGKIARLVDAIETGDAGQDERDRLVLRRRERDELKRGLAALNKASATPADPPTREWVDQKLTDLHTVLTGGNPRAAVALRDLVSQVRVTEVTPARSKRKHFRGSFSLCPPRDLAPAEVTGDSPCRPVEIEFADPLPWVALAGEVKRLIDEGVRYADIAARLGCHKTWPAKALAHWYAEQSLPAPDGRAARGRLAPAPEDDALRDRAKALWDSGMLMQEIAEEMGTCRHTVTALIRTWHASRGLPVPDGRARRKTLGNRKPVDKAAS